MSDNIVVLATYPFFRAVVIKERLMAEGIECSLANVNAISSVPGGAVRILVLEKDFTDAASVLIDMEEEFAEEKVEDAEIVEDIDKILCPVNFSEASFEAAKYALGIADKLNAELYIVHSYSFPIIQSIDFMDTNAIAYTEDKTIHEIQHEAENGIKIFVEKLRVYAEDNILIQTKVKSYLLNGHPADEVLRFAEDHAMKAIILNSRTSKSEKNISFVAEYIVANAKIPVLAIPLEAPFTGIARIHVLYMASNEDADFFAMKKLLTLLYPFNVVIHCLSIIPNENIANMQIQKWKLHFEKRYPAFEFNCMNCKLHDDMLSFIKNIVQENKIDIVSMVTENKGFFREILHPGISKKYLFELNYPVLVFHS
jgi:nucleotide-binding universal stress UspA family protein